MKLVLTGAPGDLAQMVADMRAAGVAPPPLSAGPEARSLYWTGIEPDSALREFVASRSSALQLDYAFMPETVRLSDYGLLALDMDSTLITIECIDEIADLYGVKGEVARITAAAMRGEITDFQTSLGQRLALLAGAPAAILQRVYSERLELSPGAEALLSRAQAHGLKTLVVSGGFTFFLDRLKARLPIDFTLANELELVGGRITGRVLGPIVGAAAKRTMVQETCAALGIETSRALVVGDGANDLLMMAVAGMSVAYHAKPIVVRETSQAIRFGGLDVLLDWFGANDPGERALPVS